RSFFDVAECNIYRSRRRQRAAVRRVGVERGSLPTNRQPFRAVGTLCATTPATIQAAREPTGGWLPTRLDPPAARRPSGSFLNEDHTYATLGHSLPGHRPHRRGARAVPHRGHLRAGRLDPLRRLLDPVRRVARVRGPAPRGATGLAA